MANAGYDVSQPDFPEMALYDFPVARRMFLSPQASGLTQQFYELYNEVAKTYNTLQHKLEERGEYDEFNALYQDTKA